MESHHRRPEGGVCIPSVHEGPRLGANRAPSLPPQGAVEGAGGCDWEGIVGLVWRGGVGTIPDVGDAVGRLGPPVIRGEADGREAEVLGVATGESVIKC